MENFKSNVKILQRQKKNAKSQWNRKEPKNKLDSAPPTLTPNKRRNADKIFPNNEANQNKGINYLSKYLDKHPICSKKRIFYKIENHLL